MAKAQDSKKEITEQGFKAKLDIVSQTAKLPDKTFANFFKNLMDMYAISCSALADASTLNIETVSDLRNGNKSPSRQTVLAACIAIGVPIDVTEKALRRAGHAFIAGNKLHEAYRTLATYYSGYPISECNERLLALGFREFDCLGAKTRKNKEL